MNEKILGIDIGGSGIKGAPVNVQTGELTEERHRIPTPQPATPKAVAKTVAELAKHFDWKNKPIGCTFPAIVKKGHTLSAANVDKKWIGTDADSLFEDKTGCSVTVLNDADAAGLAEMKFGAGHGVDGVVMMLTFGTGIGSALFLDGKLVPNTELGHVGVGKHEKAEAWTAARIKEEEDLSWKKWAGRVEKYLQHLEFLFSPDLFIIGGGVSKRSEKFFPDIDIKTKMVPAKLLNNAGIVGAAMAALDKNTDKNS